MSELFVGTDQEEEMHTKLIFAVLGATLLAAPTIAPAKAEDSVTIEKHKKPDHVIIKDRERTEGRRDKVIVKQHEPRPDHDKTIIHDQDH